MSWLLAVVLMLTVLMAGLNLWAYLRFGRAGNAAAAAVGALTAVLVVLMVSS